MPLQGRPRVTPEVYQARLDAYCARYKVTALDTGIPPFPAGRRETPQHREWIALYKAHSRLARRERGQCERCASPVAEGSIFCEAHRDSTGANDAAQAGALLKAQDGLCPICGLEVSLGDAVEHEPGPGRHHAALHKRCHGLASLAATFDAEAVGRLRSYLWPPRGRGQGRR